MHRKDRAINALTITPTGAHIMNIMRHHRSAGPADIHLYSLTNIFTGYVLALVGTHSGSYSLLFTLTGTQSRS